MDNDIEIFDGVTINDLYKKIYENSAEKKEKIDELISTVPDKIQTVDEAMMVIPLLKELLELGVKNDETLVKLANAVNKTTAPISLSKTENNFILSEEDKKNIANAAKIEFDENIKMKLNNFSN